LRFCDSPVFYPSRRDKISKLGVTRGNLRTEPKLKAVGRVDGLTYRERTQRSEDSPIVFFFAERIGRWRWRWKIGSTKFEIENYA
jgi:hypothetical protein